jgi:hypothetical protein
MSVSSAAVPVAQNKTAYPERIQPLGNGMPFVIDG